MTFHKPKHREFHCLAALDLVVEQHFRIWYMITILIYDRKIMDYHADFKTHN